ncbi:MAG: hypothetical protein U5L10_00725 [Candidatus Moranbacteria bacterium]|nr:hypothetical protein [Candidatus Moranbacteria bacterium]
MATEKQKMNNPGVPVDGNEKNKRENRNFNEKEENKQESWPKQG